MTSRNPSDGALGRQDGLTPGCLPSSPEDQKKGSSRSQPCADGALPVLTELQSLLARVEAATEPDRDIDADLTVALLGGKAEWLTAQYTGDLVAAHVVPSANHRGGLAKQPVYALTASLDAALALVGRVLPGWAWSVGNKASGGQAYLMSGPGAVLCGGEANTPALSLLAALLKALITQGVDDQSASNARDAAGQLRAEKKS